MAEKPEKADEALLNPSLHQKKEQPSSPQEVLRATLLQCRELMEAIVTEAIANGAEVSLLDHLEEVYNESGYVIHSQEGDYENFKGISDSDGIVSLREDRVGDIHDVLHESIHRAAKLQRLRNNASYIPDIVAKTFGLRFMEEGDALAPIEASLTGSDLHQALRRTHTGISVLLEGLTEWLTCQADGRQLSDGTKVNFQDSKPVYKKHLAGANALQQALPTWNVGLNTKSAHAFLVQTAFTGDISSFISKVGKNNLTAVLDQQPWIFYAR